MLTDPPASPSPSNAVTPHPAPPGDWRTLPALSLDWRPVAAAMEQAGLDTRNWLLFEVSQFAINAAAEHNPDTDAEGCEVCDAGTLDRCPMWRQAQRLMFAWLQSGR